MPINTARKTGNGKRKCYVNFAGELREAKLQNTCMRGALSLAHLTSSWPAVVVIYGIHRAAICKPPDTST